MQHFWPQMQHVQCCASTAANDGFRNGNTPAKGHCMPATCDTCRFFQKATWTSPFGKGALPGMCRRFPATEAKIGSDWCGEHAPRAEG